jgi:hypothetical protein
MRTKIVIWGTNEKDEKVLIGIELIEINNQVRVHIFPENIATQEFYNQMMNQWREGYPVPFPEGHEVIDRLLSMSESLLPDNLKTSSTDILNRAKSEWHFVVLSAKLYTTYLDELEEIKERVKSLANYDGGIWEEMKSFWGKVQNQSREKNLFKQHASDLREQTNDVFDKLKSLRKVMNEDFERLSKDHVETFHQKLEDIEQRIEKGLGLQPIFNELKSLQKLFKDTDFTRKHRSEIWKRLDQAFKLVKAKKYGKDETDGSALSRLERRYEGLLAAINKMEASIKRDKNERDFQVKRIDSTDGQLEVQIRQAKLAMIEERIQSKENKLQEMMRTKTELEKKMQNEQKKVERAQSNKTESTPEKPAETEGEQDTKEESHPPALVEQEDVTSTQPDSSQQVEESTQSAPEVEDSSSEEE